MLPKWQSFSDKPWSHKSLDSENLIDAFKVCWHEIWLQLEHLRSNDSHFLLKLPPTCNLPGCDADSEPSYLRPVPKKSRSFFTECFCDYCDSFWFFTELVCSPLPLYKFDEALDLEDLGISQLINELIVVLKRAHVVFLDLVEIILDLSTAWWLDSIAVTRRLFNKAFLRG